MTCEAELQVQDALYQEAEVLSFVIGRDDDCVRSKLVTDLPRMLFILTSIWRSAGSPLAEFEKSLYNVSVGILLACSFDARTIGIPLAGPGRAGCSSLVHFCGPCVPARTRPRPSTTAYITFRYARNLAQGLGFVYNPGSRCLAPPPRSTPG